MDFNKLFLIKKPIIGMIHLAGNSHQERVKRALEELVIYQEEGINGAIIEDYHGTQEDVFETFKQVKRLNLNVVLGMNLLSNPYFGYQESKSLGAKFVQFDSLQSTDINLGLYRKLRIYNPDVAVLGGVRFKYTQDTGNPLEKDLNEVKSICEAIVTTGSGTGIETPLEKLIEFKRNLKEFPLVVGAGVNPSNAYEQFFIADAAIIGSYVKPRGNTYLPVERSLIRDIIPIVKEVRKYFQD